MNNDKTPFDEFIETASKELEQAEHEARELAKLWARMNRHEKRAALARARKDKR